MGGPADATVRVTLADVVVAVACGVEPPSLVACAWLVADAAERLREIGFGQVGLGEIVLDGEGQVTVHPSTRVDDVESARSLRAALDALLPIAAPSPTGLAAKLRLAAGRPDAAGLALLGRELALALGDADRSALRRALGTLATEAHRALDGESDAAPPPPAAVEPIDATPVAETTAEPIALRIVEPAIEEPAAPSIATGPRVDVEPSPPVAPPVADTRAIEAAWEQRLAEARAETQRRMVAHDEEQERRLHALEREHQRHVEALEAEAARRHASLERDRERRRLAAERAAEERDATHRRMLDELRSANAALEAEADARRVRAVEQTVAAMRDALDAERARALAALTATHEATLRSLHAERDVERRGLQDRIDALEYALARALAERDAERTLRVDGEVSAANRLRELRRPAVRAIEPPRSFGYRDVVEPSDAGKRR